MRLVGRVWIVFSLVVSPAFATIFGTVRGTITDAQQHPMSEARVVLTAQNSQWQQTTQTDSLGTFAFQGVPLGDYTLRADARGVAGLRRKISITSGSVVRADLALPLGAASAEVSVTATATLIDPRSSTTQTTVSRIDVQHTPGADRTNSLSMITNFVPSAVIVHDQLHIRGGHQVDWLIDGVPVPNTNIAGTVGPQFDPRDVDYLEIQRGGFSAEYGERTYGIFNVVPRSGFERDNEAHLLANYGSFRSTDDQFNLGGHTERFAYYASVNGNRTDHGLETPVPEMLHDAASGVGAFASFVFLPNPSDQLRLVASTRADRYDIPNDADLEAAGIRDRQRESDLFLNATWMRTMSPSSLLVVAPFFHANSANFDGGDSDPIVTRDHRRSRYLGAAVSWSGTQHGNDIRAGAYGFDQRDAVSFSLQGDGASLSQRISPSGSVASLFLEDRYDITSRLTLRGGVRYTRFDGGLRESATTPRVGASLRLGTNVVVRASYSDVYQPPPLSTVSGPLLQFALTQGFDFLPLHGERDRQAEIGVAMPVAGWNLDFDAFRTNARNFFDHDVLGNSNIFLPITIDRVFVRGAEATVQSPLLAQRTRLHLVYSHQKIEGQGGVTGGMTNFTPLEEGRFFLDHDQRDTLVVGGNIQLPRTMWIAANVAYGSGFLQGNGPGHLPGHTTFDLAAGTTVRDWMLKLTLMNAAYKRYQLDESNTFGGTHYNDPRALLAQVEYRFHY
jgi:outer membrane cobalamin receptor